MNAEQLLPLVQQAQSDGKKYLYLAQHFVPVDEALNWKASCERKLDEACQLFEEHRDQPCLRGAAGWLRIKSTIRSAAHDYCIYLRDLCILTQPDDWPPLPRELELHPEFRDPWARGFAYAEAQLYSDPD